MRAPISLGIGPAEEFKIAVQLVGDMSFNGIFNATYRSIGLSSKIKMSILSTAQFLPESLLQKSQDELVYDNSFNGIFVWDCGTMAYTYYLTIDCRTAAALSVP